MISKLKYSVTFPNERTLEQDLSFKEGLTAIVGANEAGKSFVAEMIRFCLFGSSALRGKSEDYKNLKASMTFSLRGEVYEIERKINSAKLKRGGEQVASGVRPVNEHLRRALGFDLAVFDTTNVAKQGEVERLSSMLPADRKRMVDQTIGLDRLDDLQKWVGEEALLLKRDVETLNKQLGPKPEEPVCPDGYELSAELTTRLTAARAVQLEATKLQAIIDQDLREPQEVEEPSDPTEQKELLARAREAQAELARLAKVPTVDFDVEKAKADWELHDAIEAANRFAKKDPGIEESLDELEVMKAHYQREAERVALQASLASLEKVACPSCHHEFELAQERAREIRNRIADVGVSALPEPKYSADEINGVITRKQEWLVLLKDNPGWEQQKQFLGQPSPLTDTSPTKTDIAQAAYSISSDEKAARMRSVPDVELIEQIPVYEAAIQQAEFQQKQFLSYQAERKAYDDLRQRIATAKGSLERLDKSYQSIPIWEEALTTSTRYEQAVASYQKEQERYDTLLSTIEQQKGELEGWQAAKDFLAALRLKIKTYLLPSLSRVAGKYLSTMTGGARSSVVISEDFDITVDGQPINTLSGSGKACANLALRLGLGQVLTNGVASIFIGDEIDNSMDADRVAWTQKLLSSLSEQLSQILVITHKSIVADDTITIR